MSGLGPFRWGARNDTIYLYLNNNKGALCPCAVLQERIMKVQLVHSMDEAEVVRVAYTQHSNPHFLIHSLNESKDEEGEQVF
jgi:hypothetical protein